MVIHVLFLSAMKVMIFEVLVVSVGPVARCRKRLPVQRPGHVPEFVPGFVCLSAEFPPEPSGTI
jgi:hypothetical protein